ncbi:MAG TPA: PepSY domain-containing protein [Gammaproteobacteria bacterium]|nr:PepSY domain-containing protein [Gammaproteobacteria bacterium]
MHKHLSKWHGRIGVFAALIAIYLSITGLMLNHSHDLGLDKSRLDSSWILQLYGIKPPTGISASTREHKVVKLGETLFIDDRIIGQYSSALVGAAALDQLLIVALNNSILLLTPNGEIIETLTRSSGLPGQIERIGRADAGLLIQSGQQIYVSDADLLNWLPVSDLESGASWSKLEAIPSDTEAKLKLLLPAYGPSWERVIQDLHSGRFFKLPGILLIDLTGIVILLLSISGIISFTLRKKAIWREK